MIVVYDPQSKQLALRDISSHHRLENAECPYCHRPLRPDDPINEQEQTFVSPQYFQRLHQSLPSSSISAGPPSPRRRPLPPSSLRQASVEILPSEEDYDAPPEIYQSFETPSPISDHKRDIHAGTAQSAPGISSSAFSPGYFKRFFVEERELGRGGRGVVLLVKHELDGVSLGHFACKRVPVGDDHEWLRKVLVEVQLLQYLSHQHLVSYRHVWLEDVKLSNFGPSVPCAFILQQYCNAGDLQKYVTQPDHGNDTLHHQLQARARRRSSARPETPSDLTGRKLQFDEIYSFFKDITSGLNHLHVNGYIHRDLKPSNCLLHDSGQGLMVLVSDFGEVQIEDMIRKSTGATGTVSYCSPEVLQREYPSGPFGNFTTKSDVFSLGMILYFLCFARLPYKNSNVFDEDSEDLTELKAEISSWTGLHDEKRLRPDLPEKLYTFLRRLLSLNPSTRPSTEDILLGIKTGAGLDEIVDNRPASLGHRFEDLRNSSRISPVDTPRASNSRNGTPPTPTQRSSGYAASGSLARIRNHSYQRDATRKASTPVDNDDPPLSPGGNLILRDKQSLTQPAKVLQPIAPEHDQVRRRIGRLMVWKIALLLFRIISINETCNPAASNTILAYCLLASGFIDVAFPGIPLGFSLALAILHGVLLLVPISREFLCVPPPVIVKTCGHGFHVH